MHQASPTSSGSRSRDQSTEQTLHRRAPGSPPRIGQVRRIVSAQLRYWHLDQLIDSAALGVTELLTNVHRHAEPDKRCTVEIDLVLDQLTVSVRDHDPRLPASRTTTPAAPTAAGSPSSPRSVRAGGAGAARRRQGRLVRARRPRDQGRRPAGPGGLPTVTFGRPALELSTLQEPVLVEPPVPVRAAALHDRAPVRSAVPG
ncbi:ATP-binding protein [Streptomyces stramineus]